MLAAYTHTPARDEKLARPTLAGCVPQTLDTFKGCALETLLFPRKLHPLDPRQVARDTSRNCGFVGFGKFPKFGCLERWKFGVIDIFVDCVICWIIGLLICWSFGSWALLMLQLRNDIAFQKHKL